MKAQISLEFLIYTLVSAAALLFSIPIYVKSSNSIQESSGNGYLQALASEINANMAYTESKFYAYVPAVICESVINQSSMSYRNTSIEFNGNIIMNQTVLCEDSGGYELLEMTMLANDTYYLNPTGA